MKYKTEIINGNKHIWTIGLNKDQDKKSEYYKTYCYTRTQEAPLYGQHLGLIIFGFFGVAVPESDLVFDRELIDELKGDDVQGESMNVAAAFDAFFNAQMYPGDIGRVDSCLKMANLKRTIVKKNQLTGENLRQYLKQTEKKETRMLLEDLAMAVALCYFFGIDDVFTHQQRAYPYAAISRLGDNSFILKTSKIKKLRMTKKRDKNMLIRWGTGRHAATKKRYAGIPGNPELYCVCILDPALRGDLRSEILKDKAKRPKRSDLSARTYDGFQRNYLTNLRYALENLKSVTEKEIYFNNAKHIVAQRLQQCESGGELHKTLSKGQIDFLKKLTQPETTIGQADTLIQSNLDKLKNEANDVYDGIWRELVDFTTWKEDTFQELFLDGVITAFKDTLYHILFTKEDLKQIESEKKTVIEQETTAAIERITNHDESTREQEIMNLKNSINEKVKGAVHEHRLREVNQVLAHINKRNRPEAVALKRIWTTVSDKKRMEELENNIKQIRERAINGTNKVKFPILKPRDLPSG